MAQSGRPDFAGIEITMRCNLACHHCYSAATRSNQTPPEFTHDECVHLIDQMAVLGVELIGWTGGEPLLRDDLEDLMAYARDRHGIRSAVTTNGVLLEEQRVRRLSDASVRLVQVSLDGSTPERNARIRAASAEDFERAILGIRACLDAGIAVAMAMVLGAETLHDAPAYLDLAERLGVNTVRFSGFVPAGRGRRSAIARRMTFSPEDLERLRAFILYSVERMRPASMYDPAFGPLPPFYEYHECNAGISTFYLSCTGTVYPCTALFHRRFAVGNVRTRSLAELWEDPKMTEIARLPESRTTGRCSGCAWRKGCHGGCRGVAYACTGDLYAAFPGCLLPAQL